MRGTFISLLVASLVVALSPVARTQPETMSIVRVPVAGPSEAAYLFEHFDETHDHGPGYVELLLWPGDEAELEAAGFDHEVVVADVLAEDRRALSAPAVTVELPGPARSDY
ncbi:MAG TPA: hypothetical protein VFS18_01510, partial [Actinomycetota bacterium]|nr:hypothetical protein [Actinomycetota bacterium]